MTYDLVMIRVNIHEIKARLSHYLGLVQGGETVLICRRNVPLAELRPLGQPRTAKRPVGLHAGSFTVPASFSEPLPEPLIEAFEGRDGGR